MAVATMDIHARVPVELVKTLEVVAKFTERTKSNIIYKAVENYLREQMEDYEDLQVALSRIDSPNSKVYTWEEMEKMIAEDQECIK